MCVTIILVVCSNYYNGDGLPLISIILVVCSNYYNGDGLPLISILVCGLATPDTYIASKIPYYRLFDTSL